MNDQSTELAQQKQQPPCPVELLPEPLRTYVQSLANRYAVPPLQVLPACLTTAVAAYGAKAVLNTEFGVIPCNLFSVAADCRFGNLNMAWECVLGPFRRRQEQMFEDSVKANKPALIKKLEKLKMHRGDCMNDTPMYRMDSSFIGYSYRIAQLQPSVSPVITLDALNGASIRSALAESADGGLLFAPKDLLVRAGDLDLDLVLRCLRRQSLATLFRSNPPAVAHAPTVSTLLMMPHEDLATVVTQWNRPELRSAIICINAEASPKRLDPSSLKPLPSQAAWERQIDRIFMMRTDPGEDVKLTDDAQTLLLSFRNELADECCSSEECDPGLVMSLWELCARLSLAIWLAGTNQEQPIDKDIVTAAMAVSRSIRVEMARLGFDTKRQVESDGGDIILQRIRTKGPMRRRELYRTFNRQGRQLHDPKINRLIEVGKLVEDQSGRLMLNPAGERQYERIEASAEPGQATQ